MAADRRRRTPWFPRTTPPVHHGVYECAVMISRSVPPFLWELPWDGRGFIVPIPMVVKRWRGLMKRPAPPQQSPAATPERKEGGNP